MGRARTLTGNEPEEVTGWRHGIVEQDGYKSLAIPRARRKCPSCELQDCVLRCFGEAWGYRCQHCGWEGKQVHPNAFEASLWHGRAKIVSASQARAKAARIHKGEVV